MNFFGTNYPKVGFGLIASKCIDHSDIMTSFGQFLEILLSKYVLRSAGKGKNPLAKELACGIYADLQPGSY